MSSVFNQTLSVNCIDELYALQNEILIALTINEVKLHMVAGGHVCDKFDKLGFLTNTMETYKCIIIPNTLRKKALRFAKIIHNETGREIGFFCCAYGHQNM